MTFKAIFTAAAVSALMVGAAHAQSASSSMSAPDAGTPAMAPQGSSTMTTAVNPSATTTTTSDGMTTTTSTTDTSAAAAATFGQGASVTTSMTTNGPVPDTAANRAKYGQPMSNAGKHTAAKGN